MGAFNSERGQIKYYSLKSKADVNISPFFVKVTKLENGEKIEEKYNGIRGVITSAEMRESEYQSKKIKSFNFGVKDSEGISYISMGHNNLTYSILNSLASDFGIDSEITIELYKSKTEKDGTTYYNGKAAVKANGDRLNWAYNVDEIPKAEVILNSKGKPVIDDNGFKTYDKSDLKSFWNNVFDTKIKPKFEKSVETLAATTIKSIIPEDSPSTEVDEKKNVEIVDEEDDLPF
ncbi:MAG: hypothetical protein LBM02_09860 [Lachnospiraceae bacterium]|jgi:hypothetical protein|nr:hypothetical protein [Lachnospiraceae bacterium]